jgi:hypothetical protein
MGTGNGVVQLLGSRALFREYGAWPAAFAFSPLALTITSWRGAPED